MSIASSVRAYITQWVKVATGGVVKVEYAFFTNRMVLVCTECDERWTCDTPNTPTEIDYPVQQFIKEHSATGKHKEASVGPVKPTAVTADFKKVETTVFPQLAPAEESGLTNLPIKAGVGGWGNGVGPIDKDPAKVTQINQALAKIKSEYAKKDADLANKLKKLQEAELAKTKTEIKLNTEFIKGEMKKKKVWGDTSHAWDVNELDSLLIKSGGQSVTYQYQMDGSVIKVDPKKVTKESIRDLEEKLAKAKAEVEPPKRKKLKEATGRKFR